ncbi:hypothetical protein Hanom_Chr14g01330291 [Helianthus anomalus]
MIGSFPAGCFAPDFFSHDLHISGGYLPKNRISKLTKITTIMVVHGSFLASTFSYT